MSRRRLVAVSRSKQLQCPLRSRRWALKFARHAESAPEYTKKQCYQVGRLYLIYCSQSSDAAQRSTVMITEGSMHCGSYPGPREHEDLDTCVGNQPAPAARMLPDMLTSSSAHGLYLSESAMSCICRYLLLAHAHRIAFAPAFAQFADDGRQQRRNLLRPCTACGRAFMKCTGGVLYTCVFHLSSDWQQVESAAITAAHELQRSHTDSAPSHHAAWRRRGLFLLLLQAY